MITIPVGASNEVDVRNKKIIRDLVLDHFWLNKSSFSYFEEQLKNTEIDVEYTQKFNIGPDLRARAKVNLDNDRIARYVDKGWNHFQNCFPSYCKQRALSYKEYRDSRVVRGKNVVKIQKDLNDFYCSDCEYLGSSWYDLCIREGNYPTLSVKEREKIMKDEIKRVIKSRLETNGTYKLPKSKDIEIVISLNFADWFLCSTAQSWGSCLNLESDYESMFWGGLPALIGDKNRCMIYMTDGKKKNYKGIEVDNIVARTWGILMEDDFIYTTVEYPTRLDLKSIANTSFGGHFKSIEYADGNLESKNEVELLYNEEGNSVFIYQDGMEFTQQKRIRRGGSDHSYFKIREPRVQYGPVYDGGVSLSSMIDLEENLGRYSYDNGSFQYCEECDARVNQDEIINSSIGYICQECYDDAFTTCDNCNTDIPRDNGIYTANDEIVCERCIENGYFRSDVDGEYYPSDELAEIVVDEKEKFYTEEQARDEGFEQCSETGEWRRVEEMITLSNGSYITERGIRQYNDRNQLRLAM